jgi:hypothetical protein
MLKHARTSSRAPDPDPTLIQPADWNADHVFDGGANGQALVRDSAAPLGASWRPIILPDGSVAFVANQSMNGYRLIALADPANPQDAATKKYVDAAAALTILKDGSVPFTADQSMGGHKLIALADPAAAQDAATKNYVDGTVAAHDGGFRRVFWMGPRLIYPAGTSGVNNLWTWNLPGGSLDADGQTVEILITGGWGNVGNRQVSLGLYQNGWPDWITANYASYAGSSNAYLFRTTIMRTAPTAAAIAGLTWIPGTIGYRQPETALDWTQPFVLNIQMQVDAPSDGGFTVETILIRRM